MANTIDRRCMECNTIQLRCARTRDILISLSGGGSNVCDDDVPFPAISSINTLCNTPALVDSNVVINDPCGAVTQLLPVLALASEDDLVEFCNGGETGVIETFAYEKQQYIRLYSCWEEFLEHQFYLDKLRDNFDDAYHDWPCGSCSDSEREAWLSQYGEILNAFGVERMDMYMRKLAGLMLTKLENSDCQILPEPIGDCVAVTNNGHFCFANSMLKIIIECISRKESVRTVGCQMIVCAPCKCPVLQAALLDGGLGDLAPCRCRAWYGRDFGNYSVFM